MQTPLVSVIVSTYNHEKFISECLDGILMQQTSFPFEIILGEDESSDGTREICKSYADKYPEQIKLFLRSRKDVIYINGNPTGRYNFIENLKACNGKYIALLDGDDYWSDRLKLQKQVDLLEVNPQLIACHHWQYMAIEKEGSFVEVETPTKEDGYFPQAVSSAKNIFANQVRMKTRTLMFRNIVDKEFFPPWFYKVAFGDVPLSFLLGKHGDFGFIDEPMAVYRQTNDGVSKVGLKDLGIKKFRVQHFKNWIEIWDYADRFYEFKYHKEATETVLGFYKTITDNLPKTIGSFIKVLYYDLFIRRLPFHRKIVSSKWIILYYRKKLGYRLKRKLRIS